MMSNNSEYWINKEKRAEQAVKHTARMEKEFSEFIKDSIRDTIYFFPGFECKKKVEEKDTEIIVDDMDSVGAIFKYNTAGQKAAVLNFASYKNPGGHFIGGSKAQEECLCHESFLYNVLSQITDYYEWNNQHKNKALYLNRALYTPNILFRRKEYLLLLRKNNKSEFNNVLCDVITCAAPNKTAAQRYCNVTDEENTKSLRDRIKFVLDIAKNMGVETLILGAYGCGVFGQDPYEVASIFKEYLDTSHKCFKKVVFAIPKGNNDNYDAFEKVFEA